MRPQGVCPGTAPAGSGAAGPGQGLGAALRLPPSAAPVPARFAFRAEPGAGVVSCAVIDAVGGRPVRGTMPIGSAVVGDVVRDRDRTVGFLVANHRRASAEVSNGTVAPHAGASANDAGA